MLIGVGVRIEFCHVMKLTLVSEDLSSDDIFILSLAWLSFSITELSACYTWTAESGMRASTARGLPSIGFLMSTSISFMLAKIWFTPHAIDLCPLYAPLSF